MIQFGSNFILVIFHFYNVMICKYICRKLNQLPLNEEFRQICTELLTEIRKKNKQRKGQQLSKGQLITKFCLKLLKILQTIFQGEEIAVGIMLLSLIKSLILDIYQTEKIEIYLIKIRMYLLDIRWKRQKKELLQKLTIRLNLFLQQLNRSSFYEFISQDCYSQIERLYIQAIRQNIKGGRIAQSVTLIDNCFESMKRQFSDLSEMLTLQQKKVYTIMEKKVQIFIVLYKLELTIKQINVSQNASSRANLLFDKYERVLSRIPVPFDKQKQNIMQYSQVKPFNKTVTQSKIIGKKEANFKRQKSSEVSFPSIKSSLSNQSQSICEAFVFINDLQNRRSVKKQKEIQIISIPNDSNLNINKISRFRSLSLQTEKMNTINSKDGDWKNQNQKREVFKQIIKKGLIAKQKNQKMINIAKTKTFSLVIRSENEVKQKLRSINPFKGLTQNLNLRLSQSQRINKGLCINFGGGQVC